MSWQQGSERSLVHGFLAAGHGTVASDQGVSAKAFAGGEGQMCLQEARGPVKHVTRKERSIRSIRVVQIQVIHATVAWMCCLSDRLEVRPLPWQVVRPETGGGEGQKYSLFQNRKLVTANDFLTA